MAHGQVRTEKGTARFPERPLTCILRSRATAEDGLSRSPGGGEGGQSEPIQLKRRERGIHAADASIRNQHSRTHT